MTSVLIIEDNEDNLELIDFLLINAGYKTIHTTTGEAGLEAVPRDHPDLLICDIQLPDISGEETLKRIRKLPEGRKLPSIAMTSYAMAGDREKLLAAGFDGYIEKPFDPIRVIQQIENILKGCNEDLDR